MLQPLHVAALILLLRVGAAAVGPFEDHEFPGVIGEVMNFTVAVGGGEIRCAFADARGPDGGKREQSEKKNGSAEGERLVDLI